MTDRIQSLQDLRPGDLMFAGMADAPVKLLVYGGQLMLREHVRLGRLAVGHVGIVTEAHDPGFGSPESSVPGARGPRLVEAMPSGARERYLYTGRDWTDRHAYVRLPEDYDGQAQDAAAIARLFVAEKIPYSFLSYAALAAWRWGWKTPRLEAWIDRRRPEQPLFTTPARGTGYQSRPMVALPAEAICSVLADQAWSLAGKRVMEEVPRQVVTPGAMALQLWRRPGVIWGGPGIL